MKKVFATILAVIYLATSANAAVNLHFCMGKVYAASLVKKDNCSKCGMKNTPGCCEDQVKVIKSHDAHQLSNDLPSFQSQFALLQREYNIDQSVLEPATFRISVHNNGPPLAPANALYILNCVFRL